jgi:hypothetical protein
MPRLIDAPLKRWQRRFGLTGMAAFFLAAQHADLRRLRAGCHSSSTSSTR